MPTRKAARACHRAFLALAGAAIVALAAPPSALAWGDLAHALMTDEAVERLPEPLRGLFSGEADLKRLHEAVLAPDTRRKKDTQPEWEEEHPKHFLDIDLVTTEPYPFKSFPHERAAAEKQFGKDVFKTAGTVPWASSDALEALVEALTAGRTDDIFTRAGDLLHYGADIHQPFHVSKNYDGKMTGNDGIHKALEIGLVNRHVDFYKAEVRKDRYEPAYLAKPLDDLFDWLVVAWSRQKPILEADSIARQKANYNPSKNLADLDNSDSPDAKTYYTAFKQELEARGSPEAAAMREATGHIAELLYTAWVRAGKPLVLAPAPDASGGVERTDVLTFGTIHIPYWLIVLAAALVILLFWPRRRP